MCTVANAVCSQEDMGPENGALYSVTVKDLRAELEFRQLWQPQLLCVISDSVFLYVASCLLNSVPAIFVVKWLSGSMPVSCPLESQEE